MNPNEINDAIIQEKVDALSEFNRDELVGQLISMEGYKEENKKLKEENEEYKQTEKLFDENDEKLGEELIMMYSIIMNDGVKTEIPFMNCANNTDKLKTNITLMLEKFKMMGSKITELKEKIICLESDGCNEVSQAQYDDMEEDFKEEIKKLKEKNNIYIQHAKTLQEEKDKLEKENKDYLFDVIDNTGFDKDVFDEEADFDIEVFIHNVKNRLDQWIEESMDMREELKVIHNKLGNIVFDAEGWEKDIINKLAPKIIKKKDRFKELFMKEKKELKKLKEKYEEQESEFEEFKMDHPCDMNCEITGLTITEDDLGCSLDYGSLICESEWNGLPKEQKKTRGELQNENNKLLLKETQTNNENVSIKSEFEELKKILKASFKTDKENNELKRQIEGMKDLKKYETMIYNVWSDLYWADKNSCEVSFKDVADSASYYENKKFIKKEVIDDDDE